MNKKYRKIILILGDQLSEEISALKNCDKENDIILMCESIKECTTPKHHKKKITFILSAMRNFADQLRQNGHNICYVKLDDKQNQGSFSSEILRISRKYQTNKVKVTFPGEYRVLQELKSLEKQNIEIEITKDNRFLCDIDEFKDFFKEKKPLMENFYRHMRKKHDILMEDGKPIGGKWNYDAQNRQAINKDIEIPKIYEQKPDKNTKEVMKIVEEKFADHFGDIEPFYLATTKQKAQKALDLFIKERLKNFGTYQDAMLLNQDFIFHSTISFYLNNGLLDVNEVIKKVEQQYIDKKIPLNCAEGFIRQILGWREYIRGIYWMKMPSYKKQNFLDAKNDLPDFFWGEKTKMQCVSDCIRNTKQNSYAHHIQRLMVLGNFALIAKLDPAQVNEWYLIVYADAYEWVELPNVTGMTLFADGGVLATKPYASSGSYINKMSNYCKNCHYDVKQKTGEKACPFNYLYWNFLIENQDKFSNNHRMTMIYSVLKKFSQEKIADIKKSSKDFLTKIYKK